MKKDIKNKPNNKKQSNNKKQVKKSAKPRKIEVIVDMTELPASEAIMKSKVELGMVKEVVKEVEQEIKNEMIVEPKKLAWYQKLWEAIKSIF